MLDHKTLKKLRLGGHTDTASLMAMGAGLLATHPLLGVPPELATAAGAGMSGLGAAWLSNRLASTISPMDIFRTELRIRSSPLPNDMWPHLSHDGFLLGYTADKGLPLFVPYEDLMRHMMIAGQSGVGKTVLGSFLMFQQLQNGGGFLFVDGKLDSANILDIYTMCRWAGRADDLLIINAGDAEASNSYNPILDGDSDEISARCLQLIPASEDNPGADFYRQATNQGLATLVTALQEAGLAYNFIDLCILLMNPKALTYLERTLKQKGESKAATNLALFLDQYRVQTKDGSTLDMKRLKETFGGMGGRLFMFGTNVFGDITSSYSPEVNMYDAIRSNKVVYLALPTMGKSEAASNFGKMAVGDFRTAISWLQKLPKKDKPWPPYLAFFDEAGSYMTKSFDRPFEQARSAHTILLPAAQTLANFDAVSPELTEMITGNTWTKVFFKIGTQDTAERAAELIGYEKRVADSISSTGGSSASTKTTGSGADAGASESANTAIGEREQEEWKIHPDDLKALGKGECIVTYGGSRVYHLKVPKLDFSKDITKQFGDVKLNRSAPKHVKGINLFKRASEFLSGGDDD